MAGKISLLFSILMYPGRIKHPIKVMQTNAVITSLSITVFPSIADSDSEKLNDLSNVINI